MRLSILIPVYNEESSVETIVRRVAGIDLTPLSAPVEIEIVVVDDCSTDQTSGILARLHGGPAEVPSAELPGLAGARRTASAPSVATIVPKTAGAVDGTIPGLRLIRHGHNQGKGRAIRTALAMATGDYVIIQDADYEYDPADIPRLLKPVVDGKAQVVYGARPLDGSGGRLLLDFGNRALTVITNVLYGTRLHDMETCYKLLPTTLLKRCALECSRFDMEPEITAKVVRCGYWIHEVPIVYHPRAGGKKLSARRDGLPALWALLKYRLWKPGRSLAPSNAV